MNPAHVSQTIEEFQGWLPQFSNSTLRGAVRLPGLSGCEKKGYSNDAAL
jgi:hypothetical protein